MRMEEEGEGFNAGGGLGGGGGRGQQQGEEEEERKSSGAGIGGGGGVGGGGGGEGQAGADSQRRGGRASLDSFKILKVIGKGKEGGRMGGKEGGREGGREGGNEILLHHNLAAGLSSLATLLTRAPFFPSLPPSISQGRSARCFWCGRSTKGRSMR